MKTKILKIKHVLFVVSKNMDNLDKLKPIYFPTESNLDTELFLPVAQSSLSLDCMTGYFTSGSLKELARTIATYLSSKQSENMRFIVSPNLNEEDIDAIETAIKYDENLLPILFPGFLITEDSLRDYSVKALCYLVASGRLDLKIALKSRGMFHTKSWIFNTVKGDLAVHGSGNATKSGLTENFEQLVVSRSWLSSESDYICKDLKSKFLKIWDNAYDGIFCTELNKKTILAIHEIKKQVDQQNIALIDLKKQLIDKVILDYHKNEEKKSVQKLRVPAWLNYSSGAYAHQGLAVEAWIKNDNRGIFSVATGGGKTLTSLVAASVINQEEKLFVVISVPTTALLNQWEEDVIKFSVKPINTYKKSKVSIKQSINKAARNLRLGITDAEVILITHDALKSDLLDKFKQASKNIRLMLIGDEVHNLGSVGFKEEAPQFFKYRLGLSATYERQFDQEGTNFLIDYFGKVVFKFSLEEAINVCLVPYKYYVHQVYLTQEEEDEFLELTSKIKKLSYVSDYPDGDAQKEKWKLICLQRRRLIESAENKLKVFENILPESKENIKRTIIFCTDKYPKQIKEINSVLNNRSINFHQVTHEETSNPKLLNKVISSFNEGSLQVLTSKRVLDEGFNVPQTQVAYIIASNTVRRQWVQRLGRVLRLSPKTDKKIAVIHDFMVLPFIENNTADEDLKSLILSEYERLSFFSKLSSNSLEDGGSFYKIKKLLDMVRKK